MCNLYVVCSISQLVFAITTTTTMTYFRRWAIRRDLFSSPPLFTINTCAHACGVRPCVLSTCVFVCARTRASSRSARAGGAAHLISVCIYTRNKKNAHTDNIVVRVDRYKCDTCERARRRRRRCFAHPHARTRKWRVCQHDSAQPSRK